MDADNDEAATSSALELAAGGEPSLVGFSIGAYRVIRLLGRGGMGAVYLAEQTEPIRRQVALKVVRFGLETKQVLARFEAELDTAVGNEHRDTQAAVRRLVELYEAWARATEAARWQARLAAKEAS